MSRLLDMARQAQPAQPTQTPAAPATPQTGRSLLDMARAAPPINPREGAFQTIPSSRVTNDPNMGAPLSADFKASFTQDEAKQVKIYANNMFPNEGDEAVYRFSKDDKGNWVYRGEDNKQYRLDPTAEGVLNMDRVREIGRGAAQFAGETLPIAGGVVGGTAGAVAAAPSGPGVFLGGLAGGAGGAAVMGGARESIGNYFAGEDLTDNVAGAAGYEGAMDAAGNLAFRGLGKAISAGWNKAGGRKLVGYFTSAVNEAINTPLAKEARQKVLDAAQRLERETGIRINLTAAQVYNDEELIQLQKYLSQAPGSNRYIAGQLSDQTRQLDTMHDNVIGGVGRASTNFNEADRALGQASTDIRTGMSDDLASRFGPEFQNLDDAALPVNLTGVESSIKSLLNSNQLVEGRETAAVESILTNLGIKAKTVGNNLNIPNAIPGAPPNAQRVLDQNFANSRHRITKAFADVLDSDDVSPTTKRKLEEIRDQYYNAMESASPGYRSTRSDYEAAVQPRNIFDETDPFATGKRNPAKSLFEKGDPVDIARYRSQMRNGTPEQVQAYDDAVATWLDTTFHRTMRTDNAERPQDLANNLNRFMQGVAKSDADWARVEAIVGPQTYQALRDLNTVTQRIHKALNTNLSSKFMDLRERQASRVNRPNITPSAWARNVYGSVVNALENWGNKNMAKSLMREEVQRDLSRLTNLGPNDSRLPVMLERLATKWMGESAVTGAAQQSAKAIESTMNPQEDFRQAEEFR